MSFLDLLQVLINGTETNVPRADLRKQEEPEDILLRFNDFIGAHFYVFALAIIVLCFILFVFCCFAIVGIAATDSGVVYNHMTEVI